MNLGFHTMNLGFYLCFQFDKYEINGVVLQWVEYYTGYLNENYTDDDEHFFFAQEASFGDTLGKMFRPVNRVWGNFMK